MGGQFSGLARVDDPGRIDPVSEQDQYPLPLLLVAQPLDRQRHRITNGGLLPGQANHRIGQLRAHAVQIPRHRRHHMGLLAEHHQADLITAAPGQKIVQHRTGDHDARGRSPAQAHVHLAHAAGKVQCQHQLPGLDRRLLRRPILLRACQRHTQQRPCQPQPAAPGPASMG